MSERPIVGLIEQIQLENTTVAAKIDTGADVSSIDIGLAADLQVGPVVQKTRVKSSHGNTRRAVISLTFTLAGKEVTGFFNLADRHKLKYKLLIGKNILQEGFMIDPLKE
tara:strand:- start:141 stop:470 length:330 start_codon:yes stop_codon:yes gene_type:complete